jgi:uncharacterized protein YigE (DUF2233 family)
MAPSMLGERVQAHLFRCDLRMVRIAVADIRRERRLAVSASEYRKRSGALIAVNGGFFDEAYRPVGLVVSDGVRTNPLGPSDSGVFFITGGRAGIVHRRAFQATGVDQAVQSSPRLVVGGLVKRFRPHTARRTAVGIDRQGRVIIAVTTGPCGLAELAQLLSQPESRGGVGCVDALNLDGGPSTQLDADVAGSAVTVAGGTPVPTALLVLRR